MVAEIKPVGGNVESSHDFPGNYNLQSGVEEDLPDCLCSQRRTLQRVRRIGVRTEAIF